MAGSALIPPLADRTMPPRDERFPRLVLVVVVLVGAGFGALALSMALISASDAAAMSETWQTASGSVLVALTRSRAAMLPPLSQLGISVASMTCSPRLSGYST